MSTSTMVPIEKVSVSAYTIPTATPESDGTFQWDATTLVLVEISAGGQKSMGYSYADRATAVLIQDSLVPRILDRNALAVDDCWWTMVRAIRNLGRPGIASMAISAVDNSLWDLKAKLLGLPLASLLGVARNPVPIYGSGGFTSYSIKELQQQLAGWVESGISRVKMKIGTHPDQDIARVRAARAAIGRNAELFVDANGAYDRKQALGYAAEFTNLGVSWFEEPVSSDDLEGLHLIRDSGPPGMDITAGEYGYDDTYFRRMIDAGAVDVLQADATRCAGITGFLRTAALCVSAHVPLSSHCAPYMHLHAACACPGLRHMEYFFDHVRIAHMLLDGVTEPKDGALEPDWTRPGNGLVFKHPDAARYAIYP